MKKKFDLEQLKPYLAYIIIFAILLGTFLYVIIGKSVVKDKMWQELERREYAQEEIRSVEVDHSFMNIMFSYDEWMIEVVFEDEPGSTYHYTFTDGKIVNDGVSGSTPKDELKHYAE